MIKLNEWWKAMSGRDRGALLRLLAVGLIGVLLLGWGGFGTGSSKPRPAPSPTGTGPMAESRQLSDEIRQMLTAIPGAGTVTVAVTLNRTVKQQIATTAGASGKSSAPLLVSNGAGQRVVPLDQLGPDIAGVVVVASGAVHPGVREELTRAVETLLQIQPYQVLVVPYQ